MSATAPIRSPQPARKGRPAAAQHALGEHYRKEITRLHHKGISPRLISVYLLAAERHKVSPGTVRRWIEQNL